MTHNLQVPIDFQNIVTLVLLAQQRTTATHIMYIVVHPFQGDLQLFKQHIILTSFWVIFLKLNCHNSSSSSMFISSTIVQT